jgi:hypothetical protein
METQDYIYPVFTRAPPVFPVLRQTNPVHSPIHSFFKSHFNIVKFEVFTAVTMKNAVFGMWRGVDLVWTEVSEGRIASISMVEKFAREEPAWAGGCSATFQKTAFFILILSSHIRPDHFKWSIIFRITQKVSYTLVILGKYPNSSNT